MRIGPDGGGTALTFDDVYLVPGYSEVLPSQVSLRTRVTRRLELEIPILSAAMDTVTEAPLARELGRLGGLGVIHKNMSPERQAEQVRQVAESGLIAGAAIGVGEAQQQRARLLIEAGARALFVDSAHGHSKGVLDMIRALKSQWGDRVEVVGGNVATYEGALALIEAGADAVKVGIGPGSICTTRVVAGVGVPQLYAVAEAARACHAADVPLIADGGIKWSGDIPKALAAGASAVMLGSLFAGTDEAPGEVQQDGHRCYKSYRGMGSMGAMSQDHGSGDRYFQGAVKDAGKLVPEGIEGRVACKGPMERVVFQLLGGLRAGMGYCGAASVPELREKAQFVRISTSAIAEGHPHDVQITREAPNYRPH